MVRVCQVGKLLPNGSHTESRMRENCTYGSMRDILRAEGESRSDALDIMGTGFLNVVPATETVTVL